MTIPQIMFKLNDQEFFIQHRWHLDSSDENVYDFDLSVQDSDGDQENLGAFDTLIDAALYAIKHSLESNEDVHDEASWRGWKDKEEVHARRLSSYEFGIGEISDEPYFDYDAAYDFICTDVTDELLRRGKYTKPKEQ